MKILLVIELVKNFSDITEAEGSLSCSKKSTIQLCSEVIELSYKFTSCLSKICFSYVFPLYA
jgi:hypothetical protein